MPRRMRQPKQRSTVLDFWQEAELETGRPFKHIPEVGFRSEAHRREAWELHRDELEAKCRGFGHRWRCWAWWKYDAPADKPAHAGAIPPDGETEAEHETREDELLTFLAAHGYIDDAEAAAILAATEPGPYRGERELRAAEIIIKHRGTP